MSPEEKELLNKCVSLTEDNNKMLRSIRRSQHFDSIMRIIYWVIIIGSALFGYYLLQPYMDQVVKMYQSVSKEIQSLK